MLNRVLRFVEQLFTDGIVRLHGPDVAESTEVATAAAWVLDQEAGFRSHCPRNPPPCDRAAIEKTIELIYRAAQLAVFRELGPEEVAKLEPQIPLSNDSAAAIYSVDLVLRFLPDLTRIVRGMNPEDPLLAILKGWGAQWPLSSVGIPDIAVASIEPILSDACLSQMYIDRVIEAGAVDRLSDPRVSEMVRGAIGAFPELSPKLYGHLNPPVAKLNHEHVD